LDNKPIDEALELFKNALKPNIQNISESIEVIDSLDRVTLGAVFAKVNSPLYDSAAMDGIAVISSRTHGASETTPVTLTKNDDYIPVDTGDPVINPYDAVIMIEDILENGDNICTIRSAASLWQHVRPVGEDIVQGEMIIPTGHKIRPIDIGVLLSGGITEISVRKLPSVAVIPTGTELIEPGVPAKEGDIIESNSRMLEALVRKNGGVPVRFKPIIDEYDVIKDTLQDAAKKYDMVMIIAGTSAGREDYTLQTFKELGEVIIHGVASKPGKPVILATISEKPIIGIPGYPVSAYLTFENFVSPVLQMFTGLPETGSTVIKATLTRRLVSSLKHREFVRVKIGRVGNKLIASPLARGAGAAMSLVRADGFCVIPRNSEGIEAGTQVDVILSCGIEELENTLICIGSHDLIIDLIADIMSGESGFTLSSAHVGSMGGLIALKNNETHIAPVHLLDEETGIYNEAAVGKVLPGKKMALIKGVGRIQGIMVKKGNPLGIKGIAGLTGCRYINRQRGAGTRILLDYMLKREGVDPPDIPGYDREAATHMAVAAAIKNGNADAGMGILAAANAMDLDFIPVGTEEYDFAIPVEFMDLPHVKDFIGVLKSPVFHKKLAQFGGYTFEKTGNVEFID